MDSLDPDPGFEPQTRARSNTWPLPRPDNYVDPPDDEKGPGGPTIEAPKKNSSRRNAWGNMSYADLITQAIQSSPEKRLTLAQIYEWMVQNVAYFKDKGDSNSSAGWKNSIRHNLSLHNRFMRVQNEGTGKSSWWMINPDAKPGKAARRRATSMETQKYEKKRGRVKKKVEALRNGATPSPSSSVQSEGQDLFPESPPLHHSFQLSPDFRPRASSNASSCGGRLSPIPAVESDMHESDMPPLSPIPWNGELPHLSYDGANVASGGTMDRFTTDHLVKSLTESMKLRNGSGGDPDGSFARLTDCAVKPVSTNRPTQQQLGSGGGYTLGYASQYGSNGNVVHTATEYRPPSYQQQNSPDPMGAVVKRSSPSQQQQQQQVIETVNGRPYTLTRLGSIGNHLQQQQSQQQQLDSMQSYRLPSFMDSIDPLRSNGSQQQTMFKDLNGQQSMLNGLQTMNGTIFNKDITIKEERLSPILQQQTSAPAPSYHQHMMQQHQQHGGLLYNPFPQDLDFEPLPGGLECDVDQVIRHELSVDGNLDFNFDPSQVNGSNAGAQHAVITSSSRSWVH